MGLYEGGLLMTLLFLTIMGFLWGTGVLAQTNPGAVNALNCVPNDAGINQYAPGLDTNTIGQNCFQDTNASTISISSQQDPIQNTINAILSLLPGGNTILKTAQFAGLMLKGWVLILEILLAGGPLQVFIFIIGVPLQLLQLYFLAQVALQVIATFTGGAQPR